MKTKIIIGSFALAFAYGCTTKKSVVSTEIVKEKLEITAEVLAEGKSLYSNNCAKCHDLYDPKSFTAEEWKPIVLSMQKKAKISDEHREKIYAYLTTPSI